jgi:hypothetical protein
MSYDITKVKSDIEGALHGTTVNQITNLYGAMNRAGRKVLEDVDPMETIRISALVPLYTNVYDYPCPSDVKGDRIIDVRPQVNRSVSDDVRQTFNKEFDLNKSQPTGSVSFTTQWNNGAKTLRIAAATGTPILLNNCNSITDNGTWAVTGGASALEVDNLNYVEGSSSLKFALASTGGIKNSTMEAVDLTDVKTEGSLFVWVYLASPTNLTNVILQWGSSPSDYWTNTATLQQDGTAFRTGWNLCEFSWQTASTVGSPDVTLVNYSRVDLTTTGAINPVRIDSIVAQLGTIYEIEYYSKYLYRAASNGAFKEDVTLDTDLLNLDTDSYNLFFLKMMSVIVQQQQGSDARLGDAQYFEKEYMESLTRYRNKYLSQASKTQSTYYQMPQAGYTRYMGTRRLGN